MTTGQRVLAALAVAVLFAIALYLASGPLPALAWWGLAFVGAGSAVLAAVGTGPGDLA
jgi:hypothetical protein